MAIAWVLKMLFIVENNVFNLSLKHYFGRTTNKINSCSRFVNVFLLVTCNHVPEM